MSAVVEGTFGTKLTEVAAARHFAGRAISAWGLASDDAVLVVSELASNAVLHSGGGFEVALRLLNDAVMVEVTDRSPIVPQAGASSQRRGGRGLLIVERVSRAWGVRMANDGKTVWAEIAVTPIASLTAQT
jgi:anti-sigma regulatory factor (Ser/Thr protein kinase)